MHSGLGAEVLTGRGQMNQHGETTGVGQRLTRIGCTNLLLESGVCLGDEALSGLERYIGLIREWNDYAGLVSAQDVNKVVEVHLADGLSLVPYLLGDRVNGNVLVDVGSGGGFPGIPLAVALPVFRVLLVERSLKKVGFLRQAIGVLGLRNVDVRLGEFPVCVRDVRPNVITARAVENPRRVFKEILEFLPVESVFLCQLSGIEAPESVLFHVEHIEDAWKEAGLRRGELHVITRVRTRR